VEEEVPRFAAGELKEEEFKKLVRENREKLNNILKRIEKIDVDEINQKRQEL